MGTDHPEPSWARPGPHAVVTTECGEWARADGKPVAVVAHRPRAAPDTELPVVLLCHGLGGGHHEYAALGKHLASHGYAVLHPQFLDSTVLAGPALAAAAREGRSVRDALHAMLFDPRHWLSRVARAHAVLDSLATQRHLPVRLRQDRVLVAGHSFGAYTAQLLLGTRLFGEGLTHRSFAHPAVSGGVLMSPQGSGDRGLTPRSWEGVELPLLVVTATHDSGPRGEGLSWRREVFDRAPARLKHLAILRGGDHMLGGLPRPDGGDAAARASIAAVTAAFAARVHGDRSAGRWLADGPFPTILDHVHQEEAACPTS